MQIFQTVSWCLETRGAPAAGAFGGKGFSHGGRTEDHGEHGSRRCPAAIGLLRLPCSPWSSVLPPCENAVNHAAPAVGFHAPSLGCAATHVFACRDRSPDL